MDYCYDPDAPIITEPPSTSAKTMSCSAEIRVCPNGIILYQDPKNNCQFPTCPQQQQAVIDISPPPTPMPTSQPIRPSDVSSPAFDSSTFYCGYNLNQVNNNCASATPCPSGFDNECGGLEVCIRGTACEKTTAATAANAATQAVVTEALSETELCEDLCVDVLPSEWCPEQTSDLNLSNCLEVGVGELCESDGECDLDDALNNCGTYDIYARVVCGGAAISQGQKMRETPSPTPGPTRSPVAEPSGPPSPLPTMALITTKPTLSPVTDPPTMAPTDDTLEASSGIAISIADAIAANSATSTETTMDESSQGPTLPPITEYESHAATTFMHDRGSSGGGGGITNNNAGDPATAPASDQSYQGPPYVNGNHYQQTSPSTEGEPNNDAPAYAPWNSGYNENNNQAQNGSWDSQTFASFWTEPATHSSAATVGRIRWASYLLFVWMATAMLLSLH